jgi:hypothetical protein
VVLCSLETDRTSLQQSANLLRDSCRIVDISLLTSSLHLTVLIDFILIIISHYLIGVKEYLCFLSAERSADTGEA